jgi:hypothetical protein
MKETEYFVSLQTRVVIAGEYGVMVYSDELIAGVVCGATTQCWTLTSCSDFETRGVLRREVFSPSPKPQPGELGLCIYDPRRAQIYP